MQEIIVYIILAIAVTYAVYKVYGSLAERNSPCYGCQGCELKKQMLKKSKNKRAKPKCFTKKTIEKIWRNKKIVLPLQPQNKERCLG